MPRSTLAGFFPTNAAGMVMITLNLILKRKEELGKEIKKASIPLQLGVFCSIIP